MIEWKKLTSDDEPPKETILCAEISDEYPDGVFNLCWWNSNKLSWEMENGCCDVAEISLCKEFTHWSELNLPK